MRTKTLTKIKIPVQTTSSSVCLIIIWNIEGGQSNAPRSELMVELSRKRAWVLSATALEFRDWVSAGYSFVSRKMYAFLVPGL